jgi:hypothetical protein
MLNSMGRLRASVSSRPELPHFPHVNIKASRQSSPARNRRLSDHPNRVWVHADNGPFP